MHPTTNRPGLLRKQSSYGPALDPSLTFNDGDPRENARRNSVMLLPTPGGLERRNSVRRSSMPATAYEGTSPLRSSFAARNGPGSSEKRNTRRVSIATPNSPIPTLLPDPGSVLRSLVPLPDEAAEAQEPPKAFAKPGPPPPHRWGQALSPGPMDESEADCQVPRHGSDPGPVTQGWHEIIPDRVRAHSLPAVVGIRDGDDGLDTRIRELAKYIPKEFVQRGNDPVAKAREWIDADNIRANRQLDIAWREALEAGDYGSLPAGTSISHTSCRS